MKVSKGTLIKNNRHLQPSALSRTLTRALNITVPTVIAGQVIPIRTTVEQPSIAAPSKRAARNTVVVVRLFMEDGCFFTEESRLSLPRIQTYKNQPTNSSAPGGCQAVRWSGCPVTRSPTIGMQLLSQDALYQKNRTEQCEQCDQLAVRAARSATSEQCDQRAAEGLPHEQRQCRAGPGRGGDHHQF